MTVFHVVSQLETRIKQIHHPAASDTIGKSDPVLGTISLLHTPSAVAKYGSLASLKKWACIVMDF